MGANSDFAEFKLKPAINDNKYENRYGHFMEINEDFTFHSYSRGWCGNGSGWEIKGKYAVDTEEKITFYYNVIQYIKNKRQEKPSVSGPFVFTKENGILILKK